jgi:hypothetical protein
MAPRMLQRRKSLVAISGGAFAWLVASFSLPAAALPRYRISREQLQRVLAERFPRHYAVAGLVELEMQEPQLQLLPQQNRIASELAIDAAGPALARGYTGFIDLDFALRYEPSDRTLRAWQIRVQSVRLPGLAPDAAALIDAYVRSAARRALLEVVVHRLRPADLALADTMGLQPGDITVEPGGLAIDFVPRASR